MNQTKNTRKLKHLILCTGVLGALLRCILYTTGTDHKGLLVTGHWAHIAVWILTAAVAGMLVLFCYNIKGPEEYSRCYRPSLVSAFGCFAAAGAFLLTALPEWKAALTPLDTATAALGFASAGALVYVGICRARGSKPIYLCHAIVCISFALRMVCQYRVWSSDPQLQDYCFYMGAHVGLMLTSYHFAAFDAGIGSHRPLWFLGLACAYLSLLCLWGTPNALFMLCCAVWVLTNLTDLKTHPRRVRPALNLDPEDA
jgi:hypothetical protein